MLSKKLISLSKKVPVIALREQDPLENKLSGLDSLEGIFCNPDFPGLNEVLNSSEYYKIEGKLFFWCEGDVSSFLIRDILNDITLPGGDFLFVYDPDTFDPESYDYIRKGPMIFVKEKPRRTPKVLWSGLIYQFPKRETVIGISPSDNGKGYDLVNLHNYFFYGYPGLLVKNVRKLCDYKSV